MFHRIDDPYGLDCARYFQLAQLLPAYQGALAAAITVDGIGAPAAPPDAAPAAPEQYAVPHQQAAPSFPPQGTAVVDDIAGLARMSQQPGFPSIEYTA